MLDSPFPQWVRDHLQEMLDGYNATLPLIQARCAEIDRTHLPGDSAGTIDEYRGDGKYCAGQLARLQALQEGRRPPVERQERDSREIPMDPRKMAAWAWQNKLRDVQPVPDPREATRTLRLKDFMHKFTQREAHALILTEACGLKAKDAAREMGITERTVRALLLSARRRFGPNEENNQKRK